MKHSATQLIPIEASLKKDEDYVYQNIFDSRENVKPKLT